MISLVIFSAVLLGLAGLAFQVAKRSTSATDRALMMSTMLAKVDKATTVPFDSLSIIAVCDTTVTGTVKAIGCMSRWPITARIDSIRVDVRTTVPGSKPDTIYMRRSKNPAPVPMR